jgi:hypothetical protein
MLESVAADIRQPNHSDTDSQAAVDKAHQLLPIQKFLTSLKNDVKETGDAIKAVRFACQYSAVQCGTLQCGTMQWPCFHQQQLDVV